MDPLVTSTLISTGANLLGGLFGKKKKGPSLQEQYNIAYDDKVKQYEYMPSHMVSGFKRAGIHPLYGLSGGSAQYSAPALIGGDDNGSTTGQIISDMGNGVARAAEAYASKDERALNRRLLEAQVKTAEAQATGTELQNVKIASEARLASQAGTPPSLNSGNPRVSVVPSEIEASNPSDKAVAAGIPPSAQIFINRDGETSIMPSQQAKQASEDDILLQLEWYYRNKIIPFMREKRMFDPWNYTAEYFRSKKGRR